MLMILKKKKLKGQDTLEFVATLSIPLFAIWALLCISVNWLSINTNAALALEGASQNQTLGTSPLQSIAKGTLPTTSNVTFSSKKEQMGSEFQGEFDFFTSHVDSSQMVGLPMGITIGPASTTSAAVSPIWVRGK